MQAQIRVQIQGTEAGKQSAIDNLAKSRWRLAGVNVEGNWRRWMWMSPVTGPCGKV